MTHKNIKCFIAAVVSIVSSLTFGMQDLGKVSVYAPSKLGAIQLIHANKKFQVIQNGTTHEVQNAWLNKEIRNIETKQLAKYLAHGNLLYVNKSDDGSGNGEFSIQSHNRLNGGGAGGATVGCWVGRFVAQAIGYGVVAPIIALPALAAGPVAYGVAVAGAAGTIAPIVESASTATAIAGGMIGAVITGPA